MVQEVVPTEGLCVMELMESACKSAWPPILECLSAFSPAATPSLCRSASPHSGDGCLVTLLSDAICTINQLQLILIHNLNLIICLCNFPRLLPIINTYRVSNCVDMMNIYECKSIGNEISTITCSCSMILQLTWTMSCILVNQGFSLSDYLVSIVAIAILDQPLWALICECKLAECRREASPGCRQWRQTRSPQPVWSQWCCLRLSTFSTPHCTLPAPIATQTPTPKFGSQSELAYSQPNLRL